jgi:hypothetical protein
MRRSPQPARVAYYTLALGKSGGESIFDSRCNKKSTREKNVQTNDASPNVPFRRVFLPDGSLVWAAEGIISKVANPSGTTCNLKFPAIKEETLYWDRPVLKDPTDGDIIDFYGPCDYDPLGKESVARQRAQYQLFMRQQRSRD